MFKNLCIFKGNEWNKCKKHIKVIYVSLFLSLYIFSLFFFIYIFSQILRKSNIAYNNFYDVFFFFPFLHGCYCGMKSNYGYMIFDIFIIAKVANSLPVKRIFLFWEETSLKAKVWNIRLKVLRVLGGHIQVGKKMIHLVRWETAAQVVGFYIPPPWLFK